MTEPEPSIEVLRDNAREANRLLHLAEQKEHERRTLGSFRDQVKDQEQQHVDFLERQTSYDTDSKARLFGFGAFDGAVDGALVWVTLGAIYAVEKQPNEDFTFIKTVDGPIAVKQSPDEVFNEFQRVRFEGLAENVREAQAELARREEKVKEGRALVSAAPADASNGSGPETQITSERPNFQAVSDAVSGDNSECPDCGWPNGQHSIGCVYNDTTEVF